MLNDPQNLEFLRKTPKVFFVAMEAELDSSVTGIPVIYSGVGKARATRAMLHHYLENRELFNSDKAPLVISLGTAGSAKYNKGDIILVDSFYNNGDSFITETISFDTFPKNTGRVCASSDFFVGPENFTEAEIKQMHREFDCMDMESFALANLCKELGIRFCAIKCISDGADALVCDFDAELPRFRAKLNEFVKTIE